MQIEIATRGRRIDGTANTDSDVAQGQIGIRIRGAQPSQKFSVTLSRGAQQFSGTITVDGSGNFTGARVVNNQQVAAVLDDLGRLVVPNSEGSATLSNGVVALSVEAL